MNVKTIGTKQASCDIRESFKIMARKHKCECSFGLD